MKKNNKKGFTLAELLIVVAIIAVLVAVAIPVFTSQLEKSREGVDLANLRSAYGEAVADALASSDGNGKASTTYTMQHKDTAFPLGTDTLPSELQASTGLAGWKSAANPTTFNVQVTIGDTATTVTINVPAA